MPVPTSGACVRTSGTAWRCMFAPMSARFASSCSRNGTSAAATDTIWFGATSISWTMLGRDHLEVAVEARRDEATRVNLPFSSMFGGRLGDVLALFLERRVPAAPRR